MFSCPFKGCDFGTDSRVDFLLHMAGAKSPHRTTIEEVCLPDTTPWLQRIDYIYGAIAYHEQRQWPRLGLAVTRRVLREVIAEVSDDTTRCLVPGQSSGSGFSLSGRPLGYNRVMIQEGRRIFSVVNHEGF